MGGNFQARFIQVAVQFFLIGVSLGFLLYLFVYLPHSIVAWLSGVALFVVANVLESKWVRFTTDTWFPGQKPDAPRLQDTLAPLNLLPAYMQFAYITFCSVVVAGLAVFIVMGGYFAYRVMLWTFL